MPDESVAERVREYLDAHPALGDAIRMRIGNYSAIARRVSADLGLPATDAVLAACRRYPHGRAESAREAGVHRVMRKRDRKSTRLKSSHLAVSRMPSSA